MALMLLHRFGNPTRQICIEGWQRNDTNHHELQDMLWQIRETHINGSPKISAYLMGKYAPLYAIRQDVAPYAEWPPWRKCRLNQSDKETASLS